MKRITVGLILLGILVVGPIAVQNRSFQRAIDEVSRSRKRTAEVEELAASLSKIRAPSIEQIEHIVANAANSQCAIMFINFDWSLDCALLRPKLAEFMFEYGDEHPRDSVLFHYVDYTASLGYQPLRDLPGWQDLMDKQGSALIHGQGEIVWLARGNVLHVQSARDFNSSQELVTFTETLLASSR